MTWRNGKPLPEATADPLFPLAEIPKPPIGHPVNPLDVKGYRLLVQVPQKVGAKANEVKQNYIDNLKPPYAVGTWLPLAIDGKDYLFVFDWHKHKPSDPVPEPLKHWHRGITAYEAIEEKLLGRWRVTFDTGWSWFYTFHKGHVAFSTDIKDPPEQSWHGAWSYVGKSIKIQWRTSTEEWFLPLDGPDGVRGQSLVGQGGLSAQRC
jgi:hypothetical protein